MRTTVQSFQKRFVFLRYQNMTLIACFLLPLSDALPYFSSHNFFLFSYTTVAVAFPVKTNSGFNLEAGGRATGWESRLSTMILYCLL